MSGNGRAFASNDLISPFLFLFLEFRDVKRRYPDVRGLETLCIQDRRLFAFPKPEIL